MKEEVRVAAVQMDIKWLDLEANIAKLRTLTEKVVAEGPVDLIVFPETANCGLPTRSIDDEYGKGCFEIAEKIPGPFTKALSALAKENHTHIVSGLAEAHPTIPSTFFNSAVLIGPDGGVVGIYHKTHIPSEEKHYFYPGNIVEVFPTGLGNVAIMICADNSFPEYARVFALKGAEIVCVPYSRRKIEEHEPELFYHVVACRAFENQNFFVTADRVGKHGGLVGDGKSCIADPHGVILARADSDSEEILRATLRRDVLVEARTRQSRFRDRRPDLYAPVGQNFDGN